MNDKILELLYRSFDEKLTPAERQQLKQALDHSSELKEEQKRVVEMRNKITVGIIGTSVEFFTPPLCLAYNDFTVTTGHRTFCKRDGTGVVAFGKS